MRIYARHAQQIGPRAAFRISARHTTFTDWNSDIPSTVNEAEAEGHTYYEPDTIRRGNQSTVYPFVDYDTKYNDPVGGVSNDARTDFSPEATMLDFNSEFRLDLKSTLKFNARMANISAIEMSGAKNCKS